MYYSQTKEYREQISNEYKERKEVFTAEEVSKALKRLHVDIEPEELSQAISGNISATFFASDIVVKVSRIQDGIARFYANKQVSELDPSPLIPRVFAYDFFDVTDFEIIVLEKKSGSVLIDDFISLKRDVQKKLYTEMAQFASLLAGYHNNSFGHLAHSETTYGTFGRMITTDFCNHIEAIEALRLVPEEQLEAIERYFFKYVHVFENEAPSFIHIDFHPGNVLYEGEHITSVFDFDTSVYGPQCLLLNPLIGFALQPNQLVEGSHLYESYKDANFQFLLPILRKELPRLFDDPTLLRKLNLLGIEVGLKWVAQDWSDEWAKEVIAGILSHEIPRDDAELEESYYGKALTLA